MTITLDSVDITNLVKKDSVRITDRLNNRTNRLSFTVEKEPGNSYTPPLNKEILVVRDGVTIFSGVTVRCDDEVDGTDTLICKVSCNDFTQYLNRKLVTERYEDTTINDIVADLLTVYAPDFTDTNVNAPIPIKSVAFNRITVSECLQKLAELSNYSWYVDYDKDIHFFASNEEPAPFDLTTGGGNHVPETLKISKNIEQLRNTVLVQGGEIATDTRTVKYAGDGDRAEFDTQYKFAAKPTVTVDGTTQSVGLDFNDQDVDFDCMWDFNQKYIRFTPGNIPAAPSTGVTNVDITGDPLFPIVVKVNDPDSIAEYGVYEFTIRDENISSQQQARDRALSELRAYAATLREGSFQTYRDGLRAGQSIRITDTLRGLDERFLIQKVSFRELSPSTAQWDVEIASLKTIGIVGVLQKLLTNEELTQNEQETLISYLELQDSVAVADTGGLDIETRSGPYLWDNSNTEWGRFTWS